MSISLSKVIKGINKRIDKFTNNPLKDVGISKLKYTSIKHETGLAIKHCKIYNCDFVYKNSEEFIHGIKEIFIDNIYKLPLRNDSTLILDCGSNIGMSIIYLKKMLPNAKVIGFEPDKTNFNLLEKNIINFNLDNVILINKAVWTKQGRIGFDNSGSMSSKIDENNSSNFIETERLKDYLNNEVYFLKIDIEGAEYQVLKDIEGNLGNVENLFVEYHGNYNETFKLSEIIDILNRNNFQIYIKEAANIYQTPFIKSDNKFSFDVQLNIFAIRNQNEK